jgi:hypothetical protein
MFLTFSILTFHVTILGLFFIVVRGPKKDVINVNLGVSLGSLRAMIEVAPLALLPLDSCRALHLLLSFLTLESHHILLANRFGVLPVLILTSEDPLNAVLKSPLLLSNNMPHAERVDVGSIVDLVHDQINLTILVRVCHLRVTNFQFCFI